MKNIVESAFMAVARARVCENRGTAVSGCAGLFFIINTWPKHRSSTDFHENFSLFRHA
jgi:hypothetical protein